MSAIEELIFDIPHRHADCGVQRSNEAIGPYASGWRTCHERGRLSIDLTFADMYLFGQSYLADMYLFGQSYLADM